jgi:hypothetical protein
VPVYLDFILEAVLASQVEVIGALIQPKVSDLASLYLFTAPAAPVTAYQSEY